MKLLYISNARLPSEKAHTYQIMQTCHSFAHQAVRVELILPTRTNQEFKKKDPFSHYQLESNFKLTKIICYDPNWLIKLKAGLYIKFQAFLFALSLFFYLLFKPRKNEYIFYTRDEYLLPLLQIFSKRVVWEVHSLPAHLSRYKKYITRCRRLIVLTPYLKSSLVSLGIPAAKILVAPDGVDLKIFDFKINKIAARKKLGLPLEKIILVYTGALKTKNMDKGIADILEALRLINQKYTILFLAVGGNQPDIDYYTELSRMLKVDSRVAFIRRLPQSQLVLYHKAADILLMPFPDNQHYRYYMSPLKMFEYMASRRPIIATNLSSLSQILNKNNSLLISPDSPKELASAIIKLIHDKQFGDKLAAQALLDVQPYSWFKRAQRIISFIC